MKKLALFLAVLAIFSLVSCSKKEESKKPDVNTTEKAAVTDLETTKPDTTAKPDETTALEEETAKAEETTKPEDTTKEAETTALPETGKPKDTASSSGSITIKDPTKAPTTSAPTTQESPKQETPKAGYESITCVEEAATKIIYLAKGEHNEALSMYVPTTWTLSGNKSMGYTVYRNGAAIGSIAFVTSLSHSACEKCESHTRLGVGLDYCIQKNGSSYRRSLVFTNKSGDKIALTVDYKYMSEATLAKIKNTMRSNLLYSDAGLGSVPLSQGNGQKSILILGNSFVQTSQIGDFLGSMIAGGNKLYKVNAVSRGYYTLSSYVQDPDTMNSIRNGNYGVVFICGIYSFNEVYDLKYMVEACKQSNTTLVVFPAHNESAEFIADAKKQYYNVHFLDWKKEIDKLIDTGIQWSAFCIDDQHKHSTPLAGYVGAHMIYRSIFAEMPPSIGTSVGGYSQTYIESYLGDYVTMGGVPNFPSGEVYMF